MRQHNNSFIQDPDKEPESPTFYATKRERRPSLVPKPEKLRIPISLVNPIEESSDLSSTARDKLAIRNTPVTDSKYVSVWKRAHAKLKSRFFWKKLQIELNLFGTSLTVGNDDDVHLSLTTIPITHKEDHSINWELKVTIPWYLIHPESWEKRSWNVVVSFLLVYTATIMPYRLALVDAADSDGWLAIEYIVNLLFGIDFLINCFSAYYGKDGTLESSWKTIIINYAKGWMVFDLVACIPFSLVDTNSSSNSSSGYNSILRLLRLPRLYRLMRLTRLFKAMKSSDGCLSRLQDYCSVKHSALRLFSFFLSILTCVHLMACLWCFAPSMEGDAPNSWIVRLGFLDQDSSVIYIAGFYWAFTTLTTVGYGDISAFTSLERVLAIMWMLFGICFFSFTIGSLTSMISRIDTKETILVQKLTHIDEFIKETNLSRELRGRLRHAIKYASERIGFSWAEKHTLFSELPKKLKFEVAVMMHQGVTKQIQFFAERNEAFISATVPFLLPLFVDPLEFVYMRNDHAQEMFFIARGRCALTVSQKMSVVPLRKIQCGAYFGEIELIMGLPRMHAIQASVQCDLLTMSKQILKDIKNDFPVIFQEMVEVAQLRMEMYEKLVTNFRRNKEPVKAAVEPVHMSGYFSEFLQNKLTLPLEMTKRVESNPLFSLKDPPQTSLHSKLELIRSVQDTREKLTSMEIQVQAIKTMLKDQRTIMKTSQVRRGRASMSRLTRLDTIPDVSPARESTP